MKKNPTHHPFMILIITALSLSLLPHSAHTAIPQTITYQGYLTDPQGTAIDDTLTIHFSLYSTSSGGTPLWKETQTVTVTDGVFSTTLGTTTPLTLPFDTPYYLGIRVGSDSEMTPRQALTSVAYAFRAKEADSVKDGAVTTQVITNNAVTTDKVADDAVTGDKIAPATITSTNIASGAIGATQIGDNTITANKITPPIISSIDGVTNDGGNVDLVAGTNVTITPDDTANTITIASTGGGVGSSPWSESGGSVYRSSGNVGIGTSDPKNTLEVNGYTVIGSNSKGIRMRTDGLFADLESLETPLAINYLTGQNTLMNVVSGNVGIGTINPEQKLHVAGISQFDVGGGSISFSTPGGWPGMIAFSKNGHRRDVHFFDDFINISLSTSDKPPTLSNGIAIKENGNVGIGNTTPSQKLTVRGNLLIESASTGKAVAEVGEGLDYAEGFDVSEKTTISPGSVLIIDPNHPGKLTLSNHPYDHKVAGIVAGGRGLGSGVRLGAGSFDYDVALAGRVYCKVNTTGAGVEPGDLLTTAFTPGYAMKATDYIRAQGAILGKAMERLPQGRKAHILVLVSLQ